MSRVFVLEKPRTDLTKAEEFGNIVFVFNPDSRRSSIFNTAQFGKDVLTRLEQFEYDPANDYICVAGGTVPIVVAIAALVVTYSQIQVLLFNASTDRYINRTLGKDTLCYAN